MRWTTLCVLIKTIGYFDDLCPGGIRLWVKMLRAKSRTTVPPDKTFFRRYLIYSNWLSWNHDEGKNETTKHDSALFWLVSSYDVGTENFFGTL